MIMVSPQDGEAIRIPTVGERYRGPLPAADVAELRGVLARSLADAGFTREQIAGLVGSSKATVGRLMKDDRPAVDESMPPDEPPGIGPPEPRGPLPFVEVSASFIRELRRSYGPESDDPGSRKVGTEADVRAWIDGLRSGKVEPRPV